MGDRQDSRQAGLQHGWPPFPPFPPYPPFPAFPPYPPFPPEPCTPPPQSPDSADEGYGHTDQWPAATGADDHPYQSPSTGIGFDSSTTGADGDSDEGSSLVLPPRVSVRRPDDLLVFDVIFAGFTLHVGPLRLERASRDAYVIVEFPPQSFGEQAYLEVAPEVKMAGSPPDGLEVSGDKSYPRKNVDGGSESPPAELPAARIRMSGPSRVAVTMPTGTDVIPFSLPGVLTALREWPMRLDFNAVADSPGTSIGGIDFGQIVEKAGGFLTSSAATAATSPIAHQGAGTILDSETAIVESQRPIIDEQFRPLMLGPHEPSPTVTALELPYRLVLSPLEPAHWQHRDGVRFHRNRTELWHTRLSASEKPDVGPDTASRVRAIWSPDYRPYDDLGELIALISEKPEPDSGPAPNPDLLRMSLDPLDRSMLVTLMAGFDAQKASGSGSYKPMSSEAKRLHLSALGCLLDAEGTWVKRPQGVDLQQWRHISTLGRDHYVRVMYAGYLCPFGHAASLVKVTERKFEPIAPGSANRIAVLRQRFFIVVREPVRELTGSSHEHHGNNFPFRRVEILTRVTPNLSEPGAGNGGVGTTPPHDLAPRMLFWPMVPGPAGRQTDVPFQIAATDLAGSTTTFSIPLMFVSELADKDTSLSERLRQAYNTSVADPRRRGSTGAAVVAYAPFDEENVSDGDPRLPTRSITFAAGKTTARPRFYPEVDRAEVGIKPIQKLLSMPGFVVEVTYPDFFKAHAFDPAKNVAQIYLVLTKAQQLSFGGAPDKAKSDSLGALASPQMNLLALSSTIGPVGGKAATDVAGVIANLATVGQGTFNPLEYFNDAKILGGISLGDILSIKPSLTGSHVPKMVASEFPDRVESRFYWSTDVDGTNSKVLIPRADPGKPPTRLTMDSIQRAPRNFAQAPTYATTAALNNFKINLFGFVILWFEQLTFVSKSGQKPDVTVELRNGGEAVTFGGPLEFVNSLRQYIPSNGFSDPPSLSVTPSGISASYSLTLPAIGVGIFALSNASLGAAFNLPFDSRPASVKFNFSERQQPFNLTVSLLGGGGFFAIGVSSEGVNEIEAALEFGAAIVINLGVASGSVEVKAGIYFHWLQPLPDKGSVELAGYVRIHGELTVLGIISVSLTFNLQLGYLKEDGKSIVYGEATLTVEIEILMFSASVSVSCRREFAGGEADPKFIDLVPTAQIWTDYCDAFASDVDF